MIALIDYGAGNVGSVHKALSTVGAQVTLTRDPAVIRNAGKVVLPGVGAFGDCMQNLQRLELIPAIRQSVAAGTPFLGICVGLQVLFEVGEEMGEHRGIGLLPGRVVRFELPQPYKVPHTGWNQITATVASPLLHGLGDGAWAYFNHAYYVQARPEYILATSDYGGPFACVVGKDNLFGIQFHPEKSQAVGLHILRNFVRLSS